MSKHQSASRRSGSLSSGKYHTTEQEHFLIDCRAAYLAVFDTLDDTIENKDELCEVLQQMGRNPSRRTLNKYWTSTTDCLTFDDFCDICKKEVPTSPEELLKAFKVIDINGDGYISNRELHRVLTTKGEKMTAYEVQAIIDDVDENGDGKLNYKEFCKMMQQTERELRELSLHAMKMKSKKGDSRHSIKVSDSEDSSDEVIIGRSTSARHSSSRSASAKSFQKEGKNIVEYKKAGLSARNLTLPKPKKLKDWKLLHSKGCFFVESDGKISTHQYLLKVDRDTNVWITVEPCCQGKGNDIVSKCEADGKPIDMMLFLFERNDNIVAFTEHRDVKGKYALECKLQKGSYRLVPFTSGCRLGRRQRKIQDRVELIRKKDGKILLCKQFKEVLSDIFDICDLDGNGLLSRDEFNLFNIHTSGEEIEDAEWQVVEDKVDMKNGQITRQGFLSLNEMEAEDNEGNADDSWITLSEMGFNGMLQMDEAAPFIMEIYCETGNPVLTVTALDVMDKHLLKSIINTVQNKGEKIKLDDARDVYVYCYVTDYYGCIAVANQGSRVVKVEVDCHSSTNVASSCGSLSRTLEIESSQSEIAHFLLPVKEASSWTINFETLVH